MLYLEESVNTILSEEGQDLQGLAFVTDVLGLNMKKMEALFKKSALQYSRRRPIGETRVFECDPSSDVANLVMPEGVRAVKAVRYGVLEQIPRFYIDDFGPLSFEYEEHTRWLKVWPPITPLRVTYERDLIITKARPVIGTSQIHGGETYYYTELPTAPVGTTLKLTLGDYTMECTGGKGKEISVQFDGEQEQETLLLEGNMGTGIYNTVTRELEINFKEDEEELMKGGVLVYEYYPRYYILPDIDLQDEVFNKLFASKILEALASLRAQATQEVLHNIDLTTDELYTRVRILKRELNTLLRNTIKFSGMTHI